MSVSKLKQFISISLDNYFLFLLFLLFFFSQVISINFSCESDLSFRVYVLIISDISFFSFLVYNISGKAMNLRLSYRLYNLFVNFKLF